MIDIISQWCVYCDYPLFRENLAKYESKFNKVILYPSRHHGVVDLENFAKHAVDATWVDRVPIDYGVQDWRQAETEPCLPHSTAEWIWFREADFFVRDWDKFFRDVEEAMKYSDMIGWWNPTHFPYVHPSCLFIKREMFDKTRKDVSAHSEINGADHFSMLTRDVEDLGGVITTLQDLGYKEWEDAFHLGGLTYVYQDWKGDGTDHYGVQNIEAFYVYNHFARKAVIWQNVEFQRLSREIETMMRRKFPEFVDIDFETSKWKEFFT